MLHAKEYILVHPPHQSMKHQSSLSGNL